MALKLLGSLESLGGNVGIGTSSPEGKLNVVADNGGTASAVKTLVLGGGTDTTGNGQYIQFRSSSNVNLGSQISGSRTGAGAASNLKFYTTGSDSVVRERMVINSSGNVGIGTSSPNSWAQLETTGTVAVGGILYIKSGQKIQGLTAFPGGAGNLSINPDGGNVGIGSSAPAAKLNVASTGANAYSSTITKGTNMKGIINALSSNADDMVGIYFGTGVTSEGTHWSGITGSRSQNAVDWSTQLNFYTHDENISNLNDATQKMVIKGSGNVGIGTTSPKQKLHVNDGGIRVEKYATGLGGFISVGNGTEVAGNYSAYFFGNTNQDNAYFKGGIAYETLSATNGRGDMHFLQNSANNGTNADISNSVMTILNSGNVGIGTTSPQYRLHVRDTSTSGTIAVGADSYPMLLFSDATTGEFRLDNRNSAGAGFITFYPNGQGATIGSEAMRISTNGNVGIGTTSPVSKLDFGTAAANAKLVIGTYVNGNFWSGIGMDSSDAGIRIVGDGTVDSSRLVDVGYYSNDTSHTWTSRFKVTKTGAIQASYYGAGILKTDASGNVSLDTSTYATEGYVTTALAAYTPTSSLGTAAFAATGDFDAAGTGASEAGGVQDNLDSLASSLGTLAYSSATIPTNNNQLTNGAGYATTTALNSGLATKADTGHKYHSFSNGQQFYDSYGQNNYLRLFTENAVFDNFRFRGYSNVEVSSDNGQTWSASSMNLDTVLDGREETGINITHETKHFRFEINRSTGWPTTALFVIQSTWSNTSGHTGEVTLETWDGSAWIQRDSWVYSNFQRGYNLHTTTQVHNGQNSMRVTIKMDWTDATHNYIPLRRILLLSNYSGSIYDMQPFYWGYNKEVTFASSINVSGGNSGNWNTAYGWGDHGAQGYATTTYVDTAVSNLVDSAPATLDTLNELAAALGDDANFSTTVTNSLASRLPFETYASGTDLDLINRGTFGAMNTGSTSTNRHQNYAGVYSLGVSGVANTLQLGTASDYNASGLWVRQYNQNAASPQGIGWQNWAKVWTDNDFANNSANWNTAYGWGNHAGLYLGATAKAADSELLDGIDSTGFLRVAPNSSTPLSASFAIGSAGGRNFIQSHGGQPLDINPLGNSVNVGSNLTVSGNFGIGTASPGYPLDILDNSTRLSFSTGTGNAIIYMDGANGDLAGGDYTSLTSDGSGNFSIATGNSERLRVQHGGNVGIGTVSPSYKLDVNGTVRATGHVYANSDVNLNGGGYLRFTVGSAAASGFTVYNAAENGYLSNRITTDAHARGWGWELSNNNAVSTSSVAYHRFAYGATSVSWLANGTGNVGIGTTTPAQKLSVSGNMSATDQISVNNRTAISVAHWGNGGSTTGAIRITMPGSHSSNWSMIVLRITAYEYNSTAHTIYYVSGHDWTSGWYNNGVTKIGNGNKDIKLGFDDSKDYVILGDVGSVWNHGHVTVDVMAHPSFYNGNMDITSGWDIRQTTDLTGITTQAVTNKRVLTTSDEGSGNGIDADTVDGLQASSFLRSDTTDTATGALTLSNAGNHFNGHHYFDAYDANGNHYPHYSSGSNANGAVVNTRVYTDATNYKVFKIDAKNNAVSWDGNNLATETFVTTNYKTSDDTETYVAAELLSYTPTSSLPTNNNQFTNGAGYITGYTETDTLDSVLSRGSSSNQSAGIGTTSTTPNAKLTVGGAISAGGVITYKKGYPSLDTSGQPVAGLVAGFNGSSAMFTFTCYGHTGGYQKVVYSCWNTSGTAWNVRKVIDEGTNEFDVIVSGVSAERTFTFVSRSGTKSYSPNVVVEASGASINTQYL